jgi:hypothetical protein
MTRTLPLALTAVFLYGSLASAQSLEEKKYRREQQESLKKENIDPMNEKCGTTIEVTIDWAKFNKKEQEDGNFSTYSYCSSAPGQVASLCDDADGKPEVQKKIKKIVCTFGKRAITLKGGTLTYTVEWAASNADDYVKTFLMKNL